MAPPFDPKNQTFVITGLDGTTHNSIDMSSIDAQRVRLASICISLSVQLGLCLMMLFVHIILTSPAKLRKGIQLLHLAVLVIAVLRLTLLVTYFPGPLSEYYVAWTRDAKALKRADYFTNTTGNAFGVVQFALIEAALVMQTWALMRTWVDVWQYLVKALSVLIAVATVVVKSVWVLHHTLILHESTLPVQLDSVGEAATALGAVSIFFFCGLFFSHLTLHLVATRGVLKRPDRGLTSLEILALGNGILMLLPSIFAALDIAAGLGDTKVLPFDAGSWVQTLVVIGLPLISLVLRYRGPASREPSRRISLFANAPIFQSKIAGTTLGSAADGRSPENTRSSAKRARSHTAAPEDRSGVDVEKGPIHPGEGPELLTAR